MIPDKIYISVGTLSSNQPSEEYPFPGWQEKPYSQVRSAEYIRKDALLEWAKETYLCENASAIRKVCFKQLVEKLNSM